MREYRVQFGRLTYIVMADDNHEAKRRGIKLCMSDYPGKYTFTFLVSVARVHLTHPASSGRKPLMDSDDFSAIID